MRKCFVAAALLVGSTLLVSPPAARGQNLEISGSGGLGVAGGGGGGISFAGSAGASFGLLLTPSHEVRLDYAFVNVRRDSLGRHFAMGSYVLQSSTGSRRPFVQFGAGLVRAGRKDVFSGPSGGEHGLGGLVSVGITVDIGKRLFVRPELRSYWYKGPAVSVLPGIAVGLRF